MRTRLWSTTAAALAAIAAIAAVPGCTHRNGDVNRITYKYERKADFSPENVWLYRSSVIDTAASSSYWNGTIADGDWLVVERLRWEVTETALIGYRDFSGVKGAEGDQAAGAYEVYEGAPVAIFPIADHFDIRREYDTMTGEETNVISENRERPWYEREYMNVNWSTNLVPTYAFHIQIEQLGLGFWVQDDDPGDPKRWRFEKDPLGRLEYIEVTTRSEVEPDLYSLFGFNGPGFAYDGASQIIDIRHSFVRANPRDLEDFETLHIPDSVVLEDEQGREVRDERGFAKQVPIGDRFGLFSTFGRRSWDPSRGITAAGRQYYATIFDIWERSFDADGAPIPMHLRTPKPIHYYTNVTHPKQLLSASIDRVGGEWNKAFKDAVFLAQTLDVPEADRPYESADEVPDMFIVHENSCNPANVQEVLNGLPTDVQSAVMLAARETALGPDGRMLFDGTIAGVVERYDWANSYDNEDPFSVRQAQETQALEDLERICSALEHYTDPDISQRSEIEQFKYQRFGDLRYNMLNLIMQAHNNGWLGLGPMLADPLTGQTVNANANIAVVHLDTAVERLTQMVDAMNGLIDRGDLISGMDVQAYMQDKLSKTKLLTSQAPTAELKNKMRGRLAGLGPAQEALKEISPSYPQDRLARLAGTPYESLLVSPEDAVAFGLSDPATFMAGGDALDDALLEELSPARDGLYKKKWEAREQLIARLGLHMMDTPEFLDRFGWSVALRLKDEPDRRRRAEKIREELYTAVQLHEVGHNVGMMHNFEASSDALNYGPRFWEIQKYPTDPAAALNDSSIPAEQRAIIDSCITEMDALNDRLESEGYSSRADFTTQECLGQQETMYSSIMEYHGTWNGDFNGLGNYDKALIKFAYGRLLEVFPEENLAIDPETQDIREWTVYNDWREMPSQLLTSHAAIDEREHVRYEWGAASTRMAPPANAVPYRFCWGAYSTPWCAPGDFGPDMRSNAEFMLTRFYNYYFFSHFNRGRLWDYFSGGGIDGAINADTSVLWDFTRKMQWYVFQSLKDPKFQGTYAEDDFLATTIMGLNHFAAVIGQPGSGHYVSVPNYQVEDLAELTPDADLLAPSDIMYAWDWQGQCEALHLAEVDDNGVPTAANPGYRLGYVPLGDGRPFFLGFTEDYEDWYIRYVGNYWAKWDALYYLGYNRAWFPRTEMYNDPRVFDISWYRLFPEEVGSVIENVVLERDHLVGPVVDADGNVAARKLIDPVTGETPDYSTGYKQVVPSLAFYHQYLAMAFAHAFMSSQFDDETDFLKSFKVALEGATDDFGSFQYVIDQAVANNEDPADYVAEFVHPLSGQRLRALKTGKHPVAYEMLKRAQLSKDRFQTLATCVDDPDGVALTDPYCSCVQVVEERPNGRYCADPYLQAPGTGECAFYDLTRREDRSRETMDDTVDFVDDMRGFNLIFSEW